MQLQQNTDGTFISRIVQNDSAANNVEVVSTDKGNESVFQENLANIQKAATELVNLQKKIKTANVGFTETDQKVYADNLERLGVSAQILAKIQKYGGADDFRLLFDATSGERLKHPGNLPDDDSKKDEEEENVGEEQEETSESQTQSTNGDDNDSINVGAPSHETSIAEAKPVGKRSVLIVNIEKCWHLLMCLFRYSSGYCR